MTPQEYNDKIKSRSKIVVTMTLEVDSSESSSIGTSGELLKLLGTAMNIRPLSDWYGWDPIYVLSCNVDSVKSTTLALQRLAVPEPVEEEVTES